MMVARDRELENFAASSRHSHREMRLCGLYALGWAGLVLVRYHG